MVNCDVLFPCKDNRGVNRFHCETRITPQLSFPYGCFKQFFFLDMKKKLLYFLYEVDVGSNPALPPNWGEQFKKAENDEEYQLVQEKVSVAETSIVSPIGRQKKGRHPDSTQRVAKTVPPRGGPWVAVELEPLAKAVR